LRFALRPLASHRAVILSEGKTRVEILRRKIAKGGIRAPLRSGRQPQRKNQAL